jgi:hypothetical protein
LIGLDLRMHGLSYIPSDTLTDIVVTSGIESCLITIFEG